MKPAIIASINLAAAHLSAILLVATFSGRARAENQEACGAVMCLYTEATGHSGGGACAAYLAKYFAIQLFDHGFSAPRTASARRDFLDRCPSSDPAQRHLIDARFGAQQTGP